MSAGDILEMSIKGTLIVGMGLWFLWSLGLTVADALFAASIVIGVFLVIAAITKIWMLAEMAALPGTKICG